MFLAALHERAKKNGIRIVGNISDFQFEEDMIFDSVYHPVKEQQQKNSDILMTYIETQ